MALPLVQLVQLVLEDVRQQSLAEARNVMIERGRNISRLDPAHADASDSESLAEVCIEKTTRSRNDSDLGRNSAITTESLSVCNQLLLK